MKNLAIKAKIAQLTGRESSYFESLFFPTKLEHRQIWFPWTAHECVRMENPESPSLHWSDFSFLFCCLSALLIDCLSLPCRLFLGTPLRFLIGEKVPSRDISWMKEYIQVPSEREEERDRQFQLLEQLFKKDWVVQVSQMHTKSFEESRGINPRWHARWVRPFANFTELFKKEAPTNNSDIERPFYSGQDREGSISPEEALYPFYPLQADCFEGVTYTLTKILITNQKSPARFEEDGSIPNPIEELGWTEE
ncbi:MAG: hypothetical protein AAGF04_04445 [Chlamydiota bacterium]